MQRVPSSPVTRGAAPAHIGFDRLMGYGLEYPTAFRDTQLGTIGRGARAAT